MDPDALLRHHMSSVGGEDWLRLAGSVEFSGELRSDLAHLRYRMLIRSRPFALREEYDSIDGPVGHAVSVSNGRRAWDLEIPAIVHGAAGPLSVPPGQPGVPVPGPHGMAALERAGVVQLLLQPWTLVGVGRAVNAAVLPDIPLTTGTVAGGPVQAVRYRTGPSTEMCGLYAAADGRLLGVAGVESSLGPSWLRFDDWQQAESVLWPMRWVSGAGEKVLNVITFTEVRVRRQLDDVLFAGDPEPRRTQVDAVAPLHVVHSVLPGSGYLVVQDVRLNAAAPTSAVFDTAADRIYIYDALARAAALPRLGRAEAETSLGRSGTVRCWIDELRLGGAPLVQRRGFTFGGGSMPELLPGDQPAVVVGAAALRDDAPVLDLMAGRLVLRPSPAPSLEPLPGEPAVLHVPLIPEADGGEFVFVDVRLGDRTARLLLDTGLPFDARLSRGALAALDLPQTRAEWRSRGAVPFSPSEAEGGRGLLDLLVRLDTLELPCREGSIALQQPWVLLSGSELDGDQDTLPFDGLLGAGALLPFMRIGWHSAAGELELQPGPDVRAVGPASWVVPPRGEFLGFTLDAPVHPESAGNDGLPHLLRVSEGTAAAAAGLRAGDALSSVGGMSCRGLSPSEYWPRLWPAAGTRIGIEVVRADGSMLSVDLP